MLVCLFIFKLRIEIDFRGFEANTMTVYALQITLTFVLGIMEIKYISRTQKEDANELDQDNSST